MDSRLYTADVRRTTFYAHFETRDDLLKYTCQELFEHIFAEHPVSESSHDYSGRAITGDDMLTHILYHLKDDRARYQRIFSCESADLFWKYFQAQFRVLMDRSGAGEAAAAKKVPEEYYLNYYCSAYIESVKWWFHNGLEITPEELAAYFKRVIQ